MKISSFFALGALALLTLTAAAPRTVKAPEFESGTIRFRIGAVHLSDTATRIDADIYSKPRYWVTADTNIYLASRITDNEYPVRRIEGMPLREHVYGGDSAHIRATFVFDPLAPSDTVFDFLEKGGAWNVRGIDLNYKPKGIKTHISGTIKNRPTASWLILLPAGNDMRTNKTTLIPVDNGRFEYDLYTTDTLSYELIIGIEPLDGSWHINKFFTEGVPVNLEMDGSNKFKQLNVGPLTERMNQYIDKINRIYKESRVYDERNSLDDALEFYVPRMYELRTLLQEKEISKERRDSLFQELMALQESGNILTPAGQIVKNHMDSVQNLAEQAKYRFLETDGSLAALSIIYESLIYNSKELPANLEIFKKVYADRYPNHPYSIALSQQLSDEKPDVGKHFPDFTAPDLQGNMHTLSDLIKGKYAIIDLWASWCGGCRKHSMELIPVYEKWKDKGFTVVGVARELGDTQAMKNSIKQDGYPWLNLVELNDAANIWKKYRAANAGGKTLLVSPEGTVIAVQPEATEVDALLTKLIGDK